MRNRHMIGTSFAVRVKRFPLAMVILKNIRGFYILGYRSFVYNGKKEDLVQKLFTKHQELMDEDAIIAVKIGKEVYDALELIESLEAEEMVFDSLKTKHDILEWARMVRFMEGEDD